MATTNKGNARSEKIDVLSTPDRPAGDAILAGWQGIYHLFGGSFDKIEVGENGVNVMGFSVDQKYDPTKIAEDVGHRKRRLDFLSIYPIVEKKATPPEFTDPKEITQYTTQFFRSSVEEGSARAPKYVRDAVAEWKTEKNMAKKRGPRRKNFNLDNLDALDADALKNAKPDDLAKLRNLLESVMESAEEVGVKKAVEEAVQTS